MKSLLAGSWPQISPVWISWKTDSLRKMEGHMIWELISGDPTEHLPTIWTKCERRFQQKGVQEMWSWISPAFASQVIPRLVRSFSTAFWTLLTGVLKLHSAAVLVLTLHLVPGLKHLHLPGGVVPDWFVQDLNLSRLHYFYILTVELNMWSTGITFKHLANRF